MNFKLSIIIAVTSLITAPVLAAGFGDVIWKAEIWTVYRSLDPMTDEPSCVGIHQDDKNIQMNDDALYISARGRGGVSSYRLRYDDHPVQPLKLASELEKNMSSAIIMGADFQKVLSSKRLRIQVLTVLDRLVIEDINLLSVAAVQEVLQGDQCRTAKHVERNSSLEYSTFEDSVSEDSTPGRRIDGATIPTENNSENGENPLSGRWLSLTSNTQRQLIQDGDYLFGAYELEGAGSGTYDFKKQGNGTYSGLTTSAVKMWYRQSGNSPKIVVDCSVKQETILTVISDRRIEGKMESIPTPKSGRAQVKYAKTCGKSEKKRSMWQEFVWVRQD